MNGLERINRIRGNRVFIFSGTVIQLVLVGLLFGFGIPILIDSQESDDTDSSTRVWLYCVFFMIITGLSVLKDLLEYIICGKHKNDDPEGKSQSIGSLIWSIFLFCVMCWGLNILRILNTNDAREHFFRENFSDLLTLFHVIIYFQVAILSLIALIFLGSIFVGCCLAAAE